MVSLLDIYNIKESTFSELKKDRNPARGNKAKNREKDFKLVTGEPDPETGKIFSKVVKNPSVSNMVKDLEAEIQDFQKLVNTNPSDIVLFNILEELKDLYNKFRTHARKNYNVLHLLLHLHHQNFFAIMAALKQRNFDGVNEAEGVKHYTKDGKEWTGPTHKMPNGKLMTQDPHREDSEELFHKEDLDEMSTTGTGASFNAGSGAGYMTPNAFKKKTKEK